MATVTNLTNPYLEIDGTDWTQQATTVSVVSTIEALESTSFGDSARNYTAGLQANEITATLMLAYGAAEIETDLAALIGTTFNVVVGATSSTPAADNPVYTLTGGYLESYTGINGDFGTLSTVDLTFRGGALTRAVAP
jgi:hypothetical protein